MALGSGLSFIFDASKGETPESVARKRALAAAIMGQIGNRRANNVGEGIGNAFASIGQGIQANVLNRRADRASETGQESAAAAWNPLLASLGGQSFPAAPGASDAASSDPTGYRNAIASIESAGSGDYGAVGPTSPKLGRALGRYQIMEANIGPWSKAALGREVTPQEFLASPELQDKIFDHQFGSYVQKYGDPGMAAQAWFAGPGGVGTNRKDVLGTSVPEYAAKFNAALGRAPAAQATDAMAQGQPIPPAPMQVASLDPSIGMAETAPVPMQPGPIPNSSPEQSQFIDRMTSPQSMTGGAPMPMQGGQNSRAPQGAGSPGEIRRGPDGKTYQYAETTGMAGATGANGWIPVNIDSQSPQVQPDLSNLSVMAGGNAGVLSPQQAAQAGPFPNSPGAVQPGQQSGPSLQMLLQAASNPWLTDSQRSVINIMLKQKMDAQDPMRSLDMRYKQAQIDKLTDPNARDKFGNSVIWGQDASGKWVAMQPSSGGGLVPAQTPDGITLSPPGIGQVNLGTSYAFRDRNGNVVNSVDIDNTGKAADAAKGKGEGEAAVSYRSMKSKMPGLEKVVGELDKLADEATYTKAGQLYDYGRAQVGMEPREAAIARTKYISMVDNQILPLLRDTFGAQFTVQEGESLRATLGDPNKTPAEKKAVLESFIEQKRRDVEALALQSMGSEAAPTAPAAPQSGGVVDYSDYFGGQ